MLEIKSVEWRNFMSYGNYDTHIDIQSLGQCLITGEVSGDDKAVYDENTIIHKSNGAGKSTIPNVILWTLFGKTMHSANPGDKIVNWFTGEDCRCKITFKNDDYIVRTRRSDGKNELIFVKDGDETNLVSDTLSTLKNQQRLINRVFDLDWEVLCGSMFFNQYSKPWMEMADGTRKKAIERALHVDRFEYRAKVAKDKKDSLDKQVESKNRLIEDLKREQQRLIAELNRIKESYESFDSSRSERQKRAIESAILAKKNRDSIVKPDIDKLKAKWDIVRKVKERIQEMQDEANEISKNIATLEGTAASERLKINNWKAKAGKICSSCEQEVNEEHTNDKIKPFEDNLQSLENDIAKAKALADDVSNKISKAKELLRDKTPEISLNDATSIIDRWNMHDRDIDRYNKLAQEIQTEVNPHKESITTTEALQRQLLDKLNDAEKLIEQLDYLNRHYQYVYKAWSDRTKIKSFVFKEHIPFINERLKHYLNVFGLDIKIELTPALGISSNLWGYEFESGGERKRTDVAFMLSMFDFHEQMYGRQSNLLVLDEVDGRLDDDGIDSLISIIKNDLAPKVETVLIISHRNMMHDTFPRELIVKREGTDDFRGFSRLELV